MFTRVAGIPCQIEIKLFYPAAPMKYWRFEEYWQPPQEAEIEWEILDRRGRPAPWLERKLSPAERRRIEGELIAQCSNREED